MGIPVSLILIAVGAILAFAVHQDPNPSVDIDVVGWILMLVGSPGCCCRSPCGNGGGRAPGAGIGATGQAGLLRVGAPIPRDAAPSWRMSKRLPRRGHPS